MTQPKDIRTNITDEYIRPNWFSPDLTDSPVLLRYTGIAQRMFLTNNIHSNPSLAIFEYVKQ